MTRYCHRCKRLFSNLTTFREHKNGSPGTLASTPNASSMSLPGMLYAGIAAGNTARSCVNDAGTGEVDSGGLLTKLTTDI
jgi:hypothetical protein